MTTETRTLVAHPNIIVHLIRSQAGTFAKALVESIMNSMDAGATLIEIELDSSCYSVTDNGHGFRTRQEVLKVFEVFGFVHDDRHRDMGMFGLGRAQAFNWATNVWRTGTFRLDVDIRARGLDYELESELEPFPGLRIDGAFYEPMSELDKHNLQLELERLCKYVAVPVLFNGRELQRDPAKMRWTYEDEDAYLKVSERTTLAVYSQGVFVRDYPAHEMGVGGTLVTKHGKPLAVNMSRSDVLTHQCKLWAELRRRIKNIANKGVSGAARKSRLTDTQRDFLALESADPANAHHLKEKLVELANGRFVSPESMGQSLSSGRVILTLAEKGNRIADTAIQERSAVIVSPRTLGRFGVDSVTELASLLAKRMQASEDRDLRHAGYGFKYALDAKRVYDTFAASPVHKRLDASTVPQSKWSPAEKLVIGVVRDYSGRIGYMVRCALVDHDLVPADQRYTGARRELSVGESDTAEAFTDGKTYVALSRSLINAVYKGGLREMQRLLGVLVHEMIHDCDSSDSHAHDHAFYEVFHDVMLSASGELYDMGLAAFRQLCAKREKLTARQARELDRSAA